MVGSERGGGDWARRIIKRNETKRIRNVNYQYYPFSVDVSSERQEVDSGDQFGKTSTLSSRDDFREDKTLVFRSNSFVLPSS